MHATTTRTQGDVARLNRDLASVIPLGDVSARRVQDLSKYAMYTSAHNQRISTYAGEQDASSTHHGSAAVHQLRLHKPGSRMCTQCRAPSTNVPFEQLGVRAEVEGVKAIVCEEG